jgi:hypothetical protein
MQVKPNHKSASYAATIDPTSPFDRAFQRLLREEVLKRSQGKFRVHTKGRLGRNNPAKSKYVYHRDGSCRLADAHHCDLYVYGTGYALEAPYRWRTDAEHRKFVKECFDAVNDELSKVGDA